APCPGTAAWYLASFRAEKARWLCAGMALALARAALITGGGGDRGTGGRGVRRLRRGGRAAGPRPGPCAPGGDAVRGRGLPPQAAPPPPRRLSRPPPQSPPSVRHPQCFPGAGRRASPPPRPAPPPPPVRSGP